jgi:predicted Zn finger-like uncharacterized protein
MVAGCPKCSARYRVDAEQIGPNGAKLRCTKCSAVFLVRAPRAESVMPEAPIELPTPEPEIHSDPNPEPEGEVDSARLVLVADPDEARGKLTAEAVRGWGLVPLLVHDGVEAMLAIQRKLPVAIVLDAGLPKMFGFQVCEVVKRNESLRGTKVVLVGSIHDQNRYRRDPSDLYGADVYMESPDLPDGLLPLLREAGFSIEVGDAAGESSPVHSSEPTSELDFDSSADSFSTTEPEPQPEPEPEPELELDLDPVIEPELPSVSERVAASSRAPAPAPAETLEAEDPERTAERERAQRLARIAVSEMVLYQPEKFDQAMRKGTLEQALDLEIQEARALLRQRIGEEVRAETDFIIDELERVAKERGAQA